MKIVLSCEAWFCSNSNQKSHSNADVIFDHQILKNAILEILDYIFAFFFKAYYVNLRSSIIAISRTPNSASSGGIFLKCFHQKSCIILKNKINGFLPKTLFYK